MLDTKLEIIKVEADLKTREDAKHMSDEEQREHAGVSEKEWEQQIQEAFQKDPDVIALCEDIALADEQRAREKAWMREPTHPARQAAEQKYKKFRLQYNKLWEEKYPEISERLKPAVVSSRGLESIEDLKRRLESLKTQNAKQQDLFEQILKAQGRGPVAEHQEVAPGPAAAGRHRTGYPPGWR